MSGSGWGQRVSALPTHVGTIRQVSMTLSKPMGSLSRTFLSSPTRSSRTLSRSFRPGSSTTRKKKRGNSRGSPEVSLELSPCPFATNLEPQLTSISSLSSKFQCGREAAEDSDERSVVEEATTAVRRGAERKGQAVNYAKRASRSAAALSLLD